jgi:RNase P protein component
MSDKSKSDSKRPKGEFYRFNPAISRAIKRAVKANRLKRWNKTIALEAAVINTYPGFVK